MPWASRPFPVPPGPGGAPAGSPATPEGQETTADTDIQFAGPGLWSLTVSLGRLSDRLLLRVDDNPEPSEGPSAGRWSPCRPRPSPRQAASHQWAKAHCPVLRALEQRQRPLLRQESDATVFSHEEECLTKGGAVSFQTHLWSTRSHEVDVSTAVLGRDTFPQGTRKRRIPLETRPRAPVR